MDSVKYNELGKVKRIKFSDGKIITYKYDATGSKLSMSVTISGTTTTTDYANGFVYEGGNLSFFGSPEGRVVNLPAGQAGNGISLEYQYAIADHQGNTRIVFTSATIAPDETTASFENSGVFVGDNVNISSLSEMNYTSGGTKSQKLHGGYSSQIGAVKTLHVYPGDTITAQVYAKYRTGAGTTGNLSAIATALASAFGVSSGSTGEALNAYNGLNSYGSILAGEDREDDDTSPKGFVTIMLFDKHHNFLDAAWDQLDEDYEQTSTPPTKDPFDLLIKKVVAKEEGYAYIFISNENPTQVDIHFDNFKVTHTKSKVIQYNEYYPFGLQTANSWTRENTTTNNYLYNEGNELNKDNGWYEMFYRGYDPTTGRMLQIDPYATMYASSTTYNYALNNPVMMNDPSGGLTSVVGYTDSQLHTMYRESRYNGEYNDFSSWAADNLDGFGAGDRMVNGGDGSSYGFNGMGKLESGHWRFIPGTPTYDENGYPIIHSGKRVWVEDEFLTEKERLAAIAAARTKSGTPYGTDAGEIDCSGLVDFSTNTAGIKTLKGKGVNGWGNGVALIVGNSRKVSVDKIREGDLATFKSGRSKHQGEDGEFDHIGIITKVGYIDGKVAGFLMIHAGGSGVKEVYVDIEKGLPGYELKKFYQWDTPD